MNSLIKLLVFKLLIFTILTNLYCQIDKPNTISHRNMVLSVATFDHLIQHSDVIAFARPMSITNMLDSLVADLDISTMIYGDTTIKSVQLKYYYPYMANYNKIENIWGHYLVFLMKTNLGYEPMSSIGSVLSTKSVYPEEINFEFNPKIKDKVIDLFLFDINTDKQGNVISVIVEEPHISYNVYNEDTSKYYLPFDLFIELKCFTLQMGYLNFQGNFYAVPVEWLEEYIIEKLREYGRLQ